MPDPALTPGATVPGVDADDLCRPGYATTMIPLAPADAEAVFEAYAVAKDDRSGYAIDHLVPIELGGAAERANLWPMPTGGSMGFATKVEVARILVEAVCSGRADLVAAQRAMVANWPIAYSSTARFPTPPVPVAVPVPGPAATPIPELTPAQEDQVRAIVRTDPGLGQLVGAGRLEDRVGVYHDASRLIGGVVGITFDAPTSVDFQTPLAGCIDGRRRRVLQHVHAENVGRVQVSVDLGARRVERADVAPSPPPGPQATIRTTILRDLEPPGERCRAPSGD